MAKQRIMAKWYMYGLTLLALWPACLWSAQLATQNFADAPRTSGAGPHDLGSDWKALGFDVHDAQMTFAPAKDGGWLIRRGIPWGLPGGFVVYSGSGASKVRTIRTVLELSGDGGGDQSGRVTWLAAFAEEQRGKPLLALRFDTAGANGASTESGGPGDWGGKRIRSGLKLTGKLLKESLVTVREGVGNEPFLLLSPDGPNIDHTYESTLSLDLATGRVSVRVYDRTEDEPVYEGNFEAFSPLREIKILPKVGGFNGYANWANDKGFALRLLLIELDDAFTPIGRVLAHPRDGVWQGRFPARRRSPELNHFLGANNLPNSAWHAYGLGWARADFSWGSIEPEDDLWSWKKHDRIVGGAHREGFEVLPMLGYTASWAASKPNDGFSPPKRVEDWEDYVEHVVARYSRPPFNLRYFQVWNEPTWKAMTFWHATGPEWIDTIFIPAAKIIRRYDCEVVFGGWPVADAASLFKALAYHEAWRWTDIVDVHYFENSIWQEIYDRHIKTGKCKGIWQTEIGYHPFGGYIPNCYLRALHWGLRHKWDFPDKYKLFWFAFWGAGPDAKKCLTGPDGFISEHGKRLRAMNAVLGGATLSAFDGFALDPALKPHLDEEQPTALGFRAGKRIVIALLLDAATVNAHPMVRLTVPKLPQKPTRVRLLDDIGGTHKLTFDYADGQLRVAIPASSLPVSLARNWGRRWDVAAGYVVID